MYLLPKEDINMKTTLTVCFLSIFIVYSPLFTQNQNVQRSPETSQSISMVISYQGILTAESGDPVPDGEYAMSFMLFDSESGAMPVWTESQTVTIIGGVFSVYLGSETPFSMDFDRQLWLGVMMGETEMLPRLPLAASAYSMHTLSVEDGAITTSSIADGAVTGDKLYQDAIIAGDNISISRDIENNIVIAGSGAGGLSLPFSGQTETGTSALAVTHTANDGIRYAVQGISYSTDGRAVAGYATSETGVNYGVYAQSSSNAGYGVYGRVISPTGITYGVYGRSDSNQGRGVWGLATASSGINYALYGRTYSSEGYGVFGDATAVTGTTYGVYGRADSDNGTGVFGESKTYGVQGKATSTGGMTIGGRFESSSSNGYGVYGHATATTGINYGVYGTTSSASGYAGYFLGRVEVAGDLTKSGGSFMIDHPLDPENKILRHSFVESPDMMNVYNGNVTTDDNGIALVELPEYFETLNRDFRYQLTVIGEFAQAIVAEEIINNRFTIGTDKPGVKVSWQVTGIRKDPWAEENRIVVEEYKKAELRGYYLNPQPYRQPGDRSIMRAEPPDIIKNNK
jgi:hypothetical protein